MTEWNLHATDALIVTAGQPPPVAGLHLAMVQGAVYDAVNAIDRRYEPYLAVRPARRWYSRDAAAATAAYRVLADLVPAQEGAAADAGIACWDDKARWRFWRPITAIREADTDGDPATEPDPEWLPLIETPPFPDHPSGLACVSSSIVRTLRDFFGTDRAEFSAFSALSGTTRSYSRFSHAIKDVIDARVHAGVHFRTADEEGAPHRHPGGPLARAALLPTHRHQWRQALSLTTDHREQRRTT